MSFNDTKETLFAVTLLVLDNLNKNDKLTDICRVSAVIHEQDMKPENSGSALQTPFHRFKFQTPILRVYYLLQNSCNI